MDRRNHGRQEGLQYFNFYYIYNYKEKIKWPVLIFLYIIFIANIILLTTGFYEHPKIYIDDKVFANYKGEHTLSAPISGNYIFLSILMMTITFSLKALIVFRNKKEQIQEETKIGDGN